MPTPFSGATRNWTSVFHDVRRVMDAKPGRNIIGVSLALCRGRAVIADTSVHDMPHSEDLADIAIEAATWPPVGYEPRVACLPFDLRPSGGERSAKVRGGQDPRPKRVD
jgi:malate dehydrogenase (oxaloacetate-decarboxylating)(NADP+)